MVAAANKKSKLPVAIKSPRRRSGCQFIKPVLLERRADQAIAIPMGMVTEYRTNPIS